MVNSGINNPSFSDRPEEESPSTGKSAGSFIHLHGHSEYSLLDAICRIDEIGDTVKSLSQDAVALTDHGALFGALEFYQKMKQKGIKPIVGCEIYIAPGSRTERRNDSGKGTRHLTLLAGNNTGYHNLIKIVSIAHIDGYHYKPRADLDLLSEYRKGIVCLSGCLSGWFSRAFLEAGEMGGEEAIDQLLKIFGEEDLYLEIQNHGIEDESKVREALADFSRKKGLRLVATNDFHYVKKGDAPAHDLSLCIMTGARLSDENRLRYQGQEFYIKSQSEMEEAFPGNLEAVYESGRIADRCDLELELGKPIFPVFKADGGGDALSFFEGLCREGLRKRYETVTDEMESRLDREMKTILETGFTTYFLIVWDFIRYARSKGIPVGPGRGSVTGSLVAYCLEITDIDPLKYGLLFERFLNPDRISLPDVDIDFCYERRDEVLKYVREKYGDETVAQIITFNKMKARAVVKAVGRAMGLDFSYVDRITKCIHGINATLEDAVRDSAELRAMIDEDPRIGEIIDSARRLEGLISHQSVHAAGIVIGDNKLMEYVPVQYSKEFQSLITQYDMDTVGWAGLVKMDFLGLRNLTTIQNTVELLRTYEGIDLDIRKLPEGDEATYQMLHRGETFGVFQFEAPHVQRVMRESRPSTLEDLTAINALNRPGPIMSGMWDLYVKNRLNPDRIESHPALSHILQDTNGVLLYQEQVMRIAQELAGYTLAEADTLRKAMGKKIPAEVKMQEKKFMEGMGANGYSEEVAGEIFQMMVNFAGYGFNKSHSVAYSLISYQTAYLKAHYPLYYFIALLNSYVGGKSSAKSKEFGEAVLEAQKVGLTVLQPDINKSDFKFKPETDGSSQPSPASSHPSGSIRYGLGAVKNVGQAAVDAILKVRERGPFVSVKDFVARVDSRAANRGVIEYLIKAGAFDSLDSDRRALIQRLDEIMRIKEDGGQTGLAFDDDELLSGEIRVIDSGAGRIELAEMEKDSLGIYLTNNPLLGAMILQDEEIATPRSITIEQENSKVKLGGVLAGVEHRISRQNRPYALAQLEDLSRSVGLVLYSSGYEKYKPLLLENNEVIVYGLLQFEETGQDQEEILESAKVIVDKVELYRAKSKVQDPKSKGRTDGRKKADEKRAAASVQKSGEVTTRTQVTRHSLPTASYSKEPIGVEKAAMLDRDEEYVSGGGDTKALIGEGTPMTVEIEFEGAEASDKTKAIDKLNVILSKLKSVLAGAAGERRVELRIAGKGWVRLYSLGPSFSINPGDERLQALADQQGFRVRIGSD